MINVAHLKNTNNIEKSVLNNCSTFFQLITLQERKNQINKLYDDSVQI